MLPRSRSADNADDDGDGDDTPTTACSNLLLLLLLTQLVATFGDPGKNADTVHACSAKHTAATVDFILYRGDVRTDLPSSQQVRDASFACTSSQKVGSPIKCFLFRRGEEKKTAP